MLLSFKQVLMKYRQTDPTEIITYPWKVSIGMSFFWGYQGKILVPLCTDELIRGSRSHHRFENQSRRHAKAKLECPTRNIDIFHFHPKPKTNKSSSKADRQYSCRVKKRKIWIDPGRDAINEQVVTHAVDCEKLKAILLYDYCRLDYILFSHDEKLIGGSLKGMIIRNSVYVYAEWCDDISRTYKQHKLQGRIQNFS